MFTIEEVKAAHRNVKSGADFPQYVQDLILLGVRNYSLFVGDGHIAYAGDGDFRTQSQPSWPAKVIAPQGDAAALATYLKLHQQGGSDYPAFCSQAAETGVEKWVVDTVAMTCTYYDRVGNAMIVETIPVP